MTTAEDSKKMKNLARACLLSKLGEHYAYKPLGMIRAGVGKSTVMKPETGPDTNPFEYSGIDFIHQMIIKNLDETDEIPVYFVKAGTGNGKSSVQPYFIARSMYGEVSDSNNRQLANHELFKDEAESRAFSHLKSSQSSQRMVICTQPRRLTTINMAGFVGKMRYTKMSYDFGPPNDDGLGEKGQFLPAANDLLKLYLNDNPILHNSIMWTNEQEQGRTYQIVPHEGYAPNELFKDPRDNDKVCAFVKSYGDSVGYTIGGDASTGSMTQLEYVTEEILLRRLQGLDPIQYKDLTKCVIIDEVHERSMTVDLLLNLFKTGYQQLGREQMPMLILTSATFDPQHYASYFGFDESNWSSHIFELAGETDFPVYDNTNDIELTNSYLESDSSNYIDTAISKIEQLGYEYLASNEDKVRIMLEGDSGTLGVGDSSDYSMAICDDNFAGVSTESEQQEQNLMVTKDSSEDLQITRWFDYMLMNNWEDLKDHLKTILKSRDQFADTSILLKSQFQAEADKIDTSRKTDKTEIETIGSHLEPDILVFLPGKAQIEAFANKLGSKTKNAITTANDINEYVWNIEVVKYYRGAPSSYESRLKAKRAAYVTGSQIKAWRRVLLVTNVVETGVTLSNVGHVFDSGFERTITYDPLLGASINVLTLITNNSRSQRRGRVGRKSPGKYHALYTAETLGEMEKDRLPEIMTAKIDRIVLQAFYTWYRNNGGQLDILKELDLVDIPSPEQINDAVSRLYSLGAIDANCMITDQGIRMAMLSTLEPEHAFMLLKSCHYGLSDAAIVLLALARSSVKDHLLGTETFEQYDFADLQTSVLSNSFKSGLLSDEQNEELFGKKSSKTVLKDLPMKVIRFESKLKLPTNKYKSEQANLIAIYNSYLQADIPSQWCRMFGIRHEEMLTLDLEIDGYYELARQNNIPIWNDLDTSWFKLQKLLAETWRHQKAGRAKNLKGAKYYPLNYASGSTTGVVIGVSNAFPNGLSKLTVPNTVVYESMMASPDPKTGLLKLMIHGVTEI